jgi:hypothetical protein
MGCTFYKYRTCGKRDNWLPVTTAWHVLRLWMEERPPGMKGSYEYIEEAVADS